MQDFIAGLFNDFGGIIVFFHIIAASFLLGSMFMIVFIIKPALMDIDDLAVRYSRCIKILGRYFYYLLGVMALIISASFAMRVGLGFEFASPVLLSLVHVKEAIWLLVACNFIYMYIRLRNAKKLLSTREFFEVHENLGLIVNWLMPLNIILSMIAIYIGIAIRGL